MRVSINQNNAARMAPISTVNSRLSRSTRDKRRSVYHRAKTAPSFDQVGMPDFAQLASQGAHQHFDNLVRCSAVGAVQVFEHRLAAEGAAAVAQQQHQ